MVSNELTRVQDTSCLRIGNLWAFWNGSYYFILALWKDRNPKEFSCTKLCCSWTAVTACNNLILPPLTLSLFVWLPGSWGTRWTVNDVWFLVPHTRGVEPKGITYREDNLNADATKTKSRPQGRTKEILEMGQPWLRSITLQSTLLGTHTDDDDALGVHLSSPPCNLFFYMHEPSLLHLFCRRSIDED